MGKAEAFLIDLRSRANRLSACALLHQSEKLPLFPYMCHVLPVSGFFPLFPASLASEKEVWRTFPALPAFPAHQTKEQCHGRKTQIPFRLSHTLFSGILPFLPVFFPGSIWHKSVFCCPPCHLRFLKSHPAILLSLPGPLRVLKPLLPALGPDSLSVPQTR